MACLCRAPSLQLCPASPEHTERLCGALGTGVTKQPSERVDKRGRTSSLLLCSGLGLNQRLPTRPRQRAVASPEPLSTHAHAAVGVQRLEQGVRPEGSVMSPSQLLSRAPCSHSGHRGGQGVHERQQSGSWGPARWDGAAALWKDEAPTETCLLREGGLVGCPSASALLSCP